MDKSEQVIAGFWDIFNKRIFLDGYKMKSQLKGYKPSELHFMQHVLSHTDSNVTKLADAFYMTRSAISKLAQKLLQKGLIKSYQKPDNRKEIYFTLTKEGLEVSRVHEALHREAKARDQAVFDQVSDAQYADMLKFIGHYNKHLDREIEKLGAKRTAGYYDRL